jgi:hypothetical protein
MGQDTKERSDKEYIKISKEDFEKIYNTVNMTIDTLLLRIYELRDAYDILTKLRGILERILKKSLQIKLDESRYKIDYVRSSLISIYSLSSELKGEILDKIKKEQIDKSQQNSRDKKDEDKD